MSNTLDRFSLDGKVAVVTGGAGAIGQVYGRALAEADAFGGVDILVNNAALMAETVPLHSHVTAALHSGDVTKEEMDEIVLQFSAYYGFAKGEALAATVETAWTSRPD
ncbi:hypothetical protein AB0D74_46630 [Streptomyces sp. NPDC048278]|uniref:hypothetical protein n=1 Tax=Streptomyces sp. NPDC048278 TaxID=3155809 RepID=UPI00342F1001